PAPARVPAGGPLRRGCRSTRARRRGPTPRHERRRARAGARPPARASPRLGGTRPAHASVRPRRRQPPALPRLGPPARRGGDRGDLDRDEALLEGIAAVYGESRAKFLRRAVFGGAMLLGVLATPPAAVAARSDTSILNFDLVFEYLQSSFYLSAVRVGTVKRM